MSPDFALDPEVVAYYQAGREDERLRTIGRLEFLRTRSCWRAFCRHRLPESSMSVAAAGFTRSRCSSRVTTLLSSIRCLSMSSRRRFRRATLLSRQPEHRTGGSGV